MNLLLSIEERRAKTGGPAFPTSHNGFGMTIRDYFASKAMEGLIANNSTHLSVSFFVTSPMRSLSRSKMVNANYA